jgi:hypothetical protein
MEIGQLCKSIHGYGIVVESWKRGENFWCYVYISPGRASWYWDVELERVNDNE